MNNIEKLAGNCGEYINGEYFVFYPKELEAFAKALQSSEAVAIGEVKENGVTWYKQNPHAHPIGTKFFTHPPASVPLEKYNKLLKQRDDAIKALGDLSFECFAGIGLTQPSIKTYNDTFMVLDRLRKEIAEWK